MSSTLTSVHLVVVKRFPSIALLAAANTIDIAATYSGSSATLAVAISGTTAVVIAGVVAVVVVVGAVYFVRNSPPNLSLFHIPNWFLRRAPRPIVY
jgi:hypothetical protein